MTNLLNQPETKQPKPEVDMVIIHQSQIPPNVIKQRHLDASLTTIKIGASTNLPDNGNEIRAYFATDTGVLSIWSGSAWLSVTLS
jgi:hypothetical protein